MREEIWLLLCVFLVGFNFFIMFSVYLCFYSVFVEGQNILSCFYYVI